jgi:hypothetical protein
LIVSAEEKIRRWRLRAEEMRTMASGMQHPDVSRDLVGAASALDRMAGRAEQKQALQSSTQAAAALATEGESHPRIPRRRIIRRGEGYASRRARFLSMDS